MWESATSRDSPATASAALRFYERMDRLRLRQGEWLGLLGWGPRETPARVALRRPGLTLQAYAAPESDGPVVLLVPAPIKRAYIWDLAPGASVVRACLERGLRPYLIRWEGPEAGAGLTEYGERYLGECLDAIAAETGGRRQAILTGHSLGGILAAVFAALRPERVGGLVLLGTPLHFSLAPTAGALGPVVASAGAKQILEGRLARVPGSLVSTAGYMASPTAFGKERWSDLLRSLPDTVAIKTHMQVERWSLDELPLAGSLVATLARDLYRQDAFMAGTLRCGNRAVAAAQVVAPLLVVAESNCAIVPPAAILPFVEAAASREKRVLWYEGDVGVAIQHVGILVGRQAHARIWPQIIEWMGEIWRKLGS